MTDGEQIGPTATTAGGLADPSVIATKEDLGRALTVLRHRAGLTVREIAAKADATRSHSTIGEWFAGRVLPSASSRPLLERVLEASGVLGPEQVAAWLDAVDRVRAGAGPRPRSIEPYRGLAPFGSEDAEWFFGREALTGELVERLRGVSEEGGGLQLVVGASGAGKSSLLRAGLLPAVTGPVAVLGPGWDVVLLTPGERHSLGELSAGRVGPGGGRRLLVVDQFEEVFTLPGDESEGHRFVDGLLEVARAPGTVVVLGVRADFYPMVLRHPALAAATAGQLVVGPLDLGDLRRVIVEPARKADVTVEDGLVELLIRDVGARAGLSSAHESGALPHLSHALYAAWRHGTGKRLTVEDYRAVGGIDRAIATTAEAVFGDLDTADRALARAVFLSLVHVAEDVADTRRRLTRQELLAECPGPSEGCLKVLDRFVAARLVTADADSVRISHEALLTAWPRLREWLNDDRAGLLTARRLTEAATAWDREGRDPAALYRGSRLAVADDWARTGGPRHGLSTTVGAFLQASRDREQERQRLARRRLRQLQALTAGLVVLLVAALVVTGVAVNQQQALGQQRDQALSAKVAQEATSLRTADPPLAARLALAAYRLAPTVEARGALLSTSATPYAVPVTAHTSAVYATGYSPDGRILATASLDHTVQLWSTTDPLHPRPLGTLTAPDGITSMAFTARGLLVTAGNDRIARVWDVHDPARPSAVGVTAAHQDGIIGLAVTPDGATLATASYDKTARLWDLSDPAHPVPLATLTGFVHGVSDVAFSPTSATLVTVSFDGSVSLWDITTRTAPRRQAALTGHADRVLSCAFTPNGTVLATAGFDNTIRLWDVHDPEHPAALQTLTGHESGIVALAFSHDGRTLASGSYDRTIRVWDLTDPAHPSAPAALRGHSGTVYTVGFAPGDQVLISGGGDDTLRLWDIAGPVLTGHNGTVRAVALSPDRRLLAVGSHQTTRLWDVRDPARPRPLVTLAGHTDGVTSVAFTPDSRVLVTADLDGTARLWHLDALGPLAPDTSREIPSTVIRPGIGNLFTGALSPDGHLLLLAGESPTPQLWDVHDPHNPRRTAALPGHTDSVLTSAVTPDGRLAITGSADHTGRIWDLTDPAHPVAVATLTAHRNSIDVLAVHPRGTLLATAGADRTVRLWDLHRPRAPRATTTLTGNDSIEALAFSPDGTTLAAAGADRTIRLWNVTTPATPELVATLTGHNDTVAALTYGPDGHTLASAGHDTTARLWNTDPDTVAGHLCAEPGPNLPESVWKQYFPHLTYQDPCRGHPA